VCVCVCVYIYMSCFLLLPTSYHLLPSCLANANVNYLFSSLLSTTKKTVKAFVHKVFTTACVAIHDSPRAQNHGLSQKSRSKRPQILSQKSWSQGVGRYILQNIFLDFTTRLSHVIKMGDLFPSHSGGKRSHKNRCGQQSGKTTASVSIITRGPMGGCCIPDTAPLESAPQCNTTFALHI